MRTLKFPAGSKAFQLMHEASLVAKLEHVSVRQFRTIAAVQTKFEKAGKPLNPREVVEQGVPDVYGCPKGATVALEEEEFEMVKRLLEGTAFRPFAARDVVGCHDLLDGTPKDDDPPAPPSGGRKRK